MIDKRRYEIDGTSLNFFIDDFIILKAIASGVDHSKYWLESYVEIQQFINSEPMKEFYKREYGFNNLEEVRDKIKKDYKEI